MRPKSISSNRFVPVPVATAIAAIALALLAPTVLATQGGPLIAGRVLAPGGAPVAEAEIRLVPLLDGLEESATISDAATREPAAVARSGEDGGFALVAPSAGLWSLEVAAPGFVSARLDLAPLIERVDAAELTLDVDEGLTVRVTAGAGAPVTDALVLLRPERARFDRPGWRGVVRAGRTDTSGAVRLPKGASESCAVTVSAPGRQVSERRGVRGTAANVALGPGTPIPIRLVDSRGQPVADAEIALGDNLPHPVARTDADGRAVVVRSAEEDLLQALTADGRRVAVRLAGPPPAPERRREIVLPDRLAVAGKLIDARSRTPIAGGVVWDADDPAAGTVSDAAGAFALSGPAGHRLRIQAGAPGYLAGQPRDFQLADDGRAGPVFALVPAAAIEGRVLDPDGKPVARARIEPRQRQDPGEMRFEIGGPSGPNAVSDERGRFRLAPIDPDRRWSLHVSAEGFAAADRGVDGLEGGATVSDVEVRLSRGARIIGRVVDDDGAELAEARVEVRPAAGPRVGMVRLAGPEEDADPLSGASDSEGRFEVGGLPSGTFEVEVSRPGFAPTKLAGIEIPAQRDDDEPTDLGQVTLLPGQRIQGIVHDDDGRPVEGAEIRVRERGPALTVMSGDAAPRDVAPDAVSDPAGWFVVDDLAASTPYTVSASRGGFIDRSVPGVEAPRAEPLELVLQPSVTISGRVLGPDDEPVAGASVTLSRARTMEMGGMTMRMLMRDGADSDADGHFAFEDQVPGTASLSAVASGYSETRLDDVDVPEGEDLVEVELRLPLGAVLIGQVRAPDGRAAIGATVRTTGEADELIRMDGATSDGNGTYRLEGLVPGTVSIEAVHPEYPRAVREIELHEGINSLDLELQGGHEVAGRVTDTAGEPVSGAVVGLVPAGRGWGGPETRSEVDGAWSIPGVQDGEFTLRVDSADHASQHGRRRVVVDGEPVYGVDTVLDAGATLSGTVGGVAPERLPSISVRVRGAGFDAVPVDRAGVYRVEHLAAGTYEVSASLADSARQARGTVTIAPSQSEATLDLELERGLVLSGRAVQGERPLSGATLYVGGVDLAHEGFTETDSDGAFSLDGLQPGTYELNLQQFRSGLSYRESIELSSDRQIELRVPTAAVVGTVVDGADRRALAGATVRLTADAPADAGSAATVLSATSDVNGRFEVDNVPDGSWRATATKKGYAATTSPVQVQFQRPVDDLRIEMDPTEGLTVEIRLPGGAPPDQARIAVLDPSGIPIMSGNYATGEGGRVRLSSVPAGGWEVLVSAAGAATTAIGVQAPGPPVPVRLDQATALHVEVPALRDGSTTAVLRLDRGDGRPFRALDWDGRPEADWRVGAGGVDLIALPPGPWTVTVTAADGRSWRATTTTTPGSPETLVLEGDGLGAGNDGS